MTLNKSKNKNDTSFLSHPLATLVGLGLLGLGPANNFWEGLTQTIEESHCLGKQPIVSWNTLTTKFNIGIL